jgi:hypothetical protein
MRREAASRSSASGRNTFLPGDETVLHLFEAASPEALSEAARGAALPYDRIVEAVEGPPSPHEARRRG